MNKGRKANDELRFFISRNYEEMSDGEIASDFGVSTVKVKQIRRRLGLQKAGRPTMSVEERYNQDVLRRRGVEERREKRILRAIGEV